MCIRDRLPPFLSRSPSTLPLSTKNIADARVWCYQVSVWLVCRIPVHHSDDAGAYGAGSGAANEFTEEEAKSVCPRP
eukprot:3082329-Rhodomonas_salina.1